MLSWVFPLVMGYLLGVLSESLWNSHKERKARSRKLKALEGDDEWPHPWKRK